MLWDEYFHSICKAVSNNSKCLSRQIGAILVRDKVIICTGYNGPPRGIPHCNGDICPRRAKGYVSGDGLHLCPAAHAECNAIVQAARLGIQTRGAILYLNTQIPCKDCLIKIINSGIEEVVCTEMKQYDFLTDFLLANSNIKIRLFSHMEEK